MGTDGHTDTPQVVYPCRCGARIRLPATTTGRQARCRKCGAVFTVPAASPAHFEPPPVIIEIEPDEDDLPTHVGPTGKAYWADLGWNFVFFAFEGNFITWLGVAFAHLVLVGLSMLPMIGMRLYFVFWRAKGIIAGWLCAFYLSTVLEAASDEDGLPDVWVSDYTELLDSLLDFIGAVAVALLPWIVLRILQAFSSWPIPDAAILAAGIAGVFLWPAIVLTTAIGRSWAGLWPHIVLRVPLAGPLAYLAICAMGALAVVLAGPVDLFMIQASIPRISGANPWALAVGGCLLTSYIGIVSMRAIGLYYRHYKGKLPFDAE